MQINVLLSLFLAVVAVVFSLLLIEEESIFAFYGRLINRLPTWISKPLGLCELCFSGQLALWSGFFMDNYSIPKHVVFVSLTILLTRVVGKLWEVTE